MANEFIIRKGLVVSGASQQALRTVGNGNILIGAGTTDNGYLLDVNGTVRVVGVFRSQNSVDWYRSDGTLVLNYNNSGNVIDINPNNGSSITFRVRNSTNSFALSVAGDAKGVGFGIASANATIHTQSSQTSSSSIARGVYFADTLTSVANGDTLIGLDVRPTFSVGSYSGYTLLSLRSSGDTLFTTTGGTNTLRTFRTGNILIGSGSTDLGSTLSVIGSSLMSGNTSGSTLLNVVGSQGQLFSVVDTLTGSLMSVNDITGLPILEVFSDDRVVMGEYATNALVVSGRSTGFGVTPSDPNYRIISSGSTLFSGGTMVVKGSGTTSGSTAFAVQNSTGGTMVTVNNGGYVGIGINPTTTLQVLRGTAGLMAKNQYETAAFEYNGDNKIGVYSSVSSIGSSGVSVLLGMSNYTIGARYPGFEFQYVPNATLANNVVKYNFVGRDVSGVVTDATIDLFNIYQDGRVIINGSGAGGYSANSKLLIGTTTDAGYKLDVNGTARLNSTTLIEGPLTVNYGGVNGGTSIVANGNTAHNSGRGIYTTGYAYGIQANHTMVGNWSDQPNAAGVHGTGQIGVFGSGDIAGFSGPSAFFTVLNGNSRVSARSHISTFQIRGSGSTELTNTLLLENSSGIKTFTVNDNGNVLIGLSGSTGQKLQVSGTSLFTGTFTSLTGGSSQVLYNMDLSQSAITGNTIYAVNVSPTLRNTASGQTQVALRVMPTFTGSSTGTSTTNKIVDFGSAGVGTQFTVTDATTGDIYMVNDVSGLPIIAANSSWDVSMYNYPNTVFKKTNNSLLLGVQNNTGSTVSIYGDLVINEGFGFTNTTTQVSGTTSTGATSAATIYTLTTSTNKSYSITCLTTGYGNTTRNTTSGRVEGAFRNSGGTLTMVGTTIQYVSANIESTNVDFEISGTSIVLRVTGTTSENYTWGSTITSQVI